MAIRSKNIAEQWNFLESIYFEQNENGSIPTVPNGILIFLFYFDSSMRIMCGANALWSTQKISLMDLWEFCLKIMLIKTSPSRTVTYLKKKIEGKLLQKTQVLLDKWRGKVDLADFISLLCVDRFCLFLNVERRK